MKVATIVLWVVLVLLVGAAFYAGTTMAGRFAAGSEPKNMVAVTLDNNLIYFGHLKDKNSAYVRLENAYFIRSNTGATDKTAGTAPPFVLTKVGESEVYGPKDTLEINRDHILLIQELKDDSEVIKTIEAGTKE